MSKKISICFAIILIIVTCASCKADAPYLVSSYLNLLATSSGIGEQESIDDNFIALEKWGIVEAKDYDLLNEQLEYEYLNKTICALIEKDHDYLIDNNWVSSSTKNETKINETQAREIINKALMFIDNKTFESNYDYKYTKELKKDDREIGDLYLDENDNIYKIVTEDGNRNAQFDEVFSYLDIADTYYIDFTKAEVTPYGEEDNSIYSNNLYTLLATNNHVFNSNGFRISYTLHSAGIDVHISKNVNGINLYGDVSVNNVMPSFKWTYDKGDLKNCYFNITMNTTEKIGASIGRYGNYYLRLKDLDSKSFASAIKGIITPKKDEVEAIIPICSIKTPIANIPTAYLNLELLVKLYVSGKVEVVLYNSHNMGFETKNGQIRYINDHQNRIDSAISSSAKASLGLNLGLDAATFRLFDIELDGGIKSEVKSTMHLYDEDGNVTSQSLDLAYASLDELAKENVDVKVCGDISLYWLLDLKINTSKSVMYKLGFSKTFNILDEDNQVFHNLHHIENGHFVERCTVKNKTTVSSFSSVSAKNKIVLDSYAEVINVNDTYKIHINSLPNGYSEDDVLYESEDSEIAYVNRKTIFALKPGSVKIKVYTKDLKHSAYINVLVSTG